MRWQRRPEEGLNGDADNDADVKKTQKLSSEKRDGTEREVLKG